MINLDEVKENPEVSLLKVRLAREHKQNELLKDENTEFKSYIIDLVRKLYRQEELIKKIRRTKKSTIEFLENKIMDNKKKDNLAEAIHDYTDRRL